MISTWRLVLEGTCVATLVWCAVFLISTILLEPQYGIYITLSLLTLNIIFMIRYLSRDFRVAPRDFKNIIMLAHLGFCCYCMFFISLRTHVYPLVLLWGKETGMYLRRYYWVWIYAEILFCILIWCHVFCDIKPLSMYHFYFHWRFRLWNTRPLWIWRLYRRLHLRLRRSSVTVEEADE